MSAVDPMDLTATALAEAVNTGDLAPVDVAEAALARTAERNGPLNALVDVDPALVVAEATAVSERLAKGERLPLAGVPLVVKDNLWVEGRRITQGSKLFADYIAPTDALAVARARAAGAIVLGIGACSEFGCKGVTSTPLHGITRNPVDPSLTPGGSSGGPASAVAARMAPLALGTDGGGSGRRPPAHCGLVGFKPSLGAIAYGPGFAEPAWDIAVISPIARTVADAILLFDATVGFAPEDPTSHVELKPARPSSDLKIAFAPRLGLDVPVDHDVEAATQQAVDALRAAGIDLVDVDPVWPQHATETALMPLQHGGLAALYGERWLAEPDLFDPDIGAQIESGLAMNAADVARALEASRSIREALAIYFAEVDLLLSPTTPCPAWPAEKLGPDLIGGVPVGSRGHAVFTPFMNHARVPAITIPCGFTPEGLPLGMQIAAAIGQDRSVLAAALSFEHMLAQSGLTQEATSP